MALSVAACGAHEDGLERVFDACGTTALAIAADASPSELAAIEAARDLWRDVGLEIRIAEAAVPDENNQDSVLLPIAFEVAAPVFFGIYRPAKGDILINRRLSGMPQAITIAHEIGHAFGLAHVTGRSSLMNPGNLVVPPGADDARLIQAQQGCPAGRPDDLSAPH